MADKEHSFPIPSTLLVQSQEGKEGKVHNYSYTTLSPHALIIATYTEIGPVDVHQAHTRRGITICYTYRLF